MKPQYEKAIPREYETRREYQKPIIVRQVKMTFPWNIVETMAGKTITCKQCSSCHGCR